MSHEVNGLRVEHLRRGWFERKLLGHPEHRVDIHISDEIVVSGEADTVESAWRGAVLAAEGLAGVKITDPNPFTPPAVSGTLDAPLPPPHRLPRHGDPDPTPRVLRYWRF